MKTRLATLRVALEGKVPTEIRLFPFGLIETTKGVFNFTQQSAELVMADNASYGNDRSADYEHQALAEPPIEAPASAWYRLELRDDGLWAVDIRWTERAKKMIEAKEYRYISPAFPHYEDGTIAGFLNFALTNIPATLNMDALVALRMGVEHEVSGELKTRLEQLGMNLYQLMDQMRSVLEKRFASMLGKDEWLNIADFFTDRVVFGVAGKLFEVEFAVQNGEIVLGAEAVEVEKTYTPREGDSMKTLLAKLGLGAEATESAAVAAVETLSARVAVLTKLQELAGEGKDLLATVLAWRDGAKAGATALEQLATVRRAQNETAVAGMFVRATSEKKCTPALEQKLRTLFADEAGQVDAAKLSQYFEVAQPIAALTSNSGELPKAPSGSSIDISKGYAGLTGAQRAQLSQENPELFKQLRDAYRKEQGL